MAVSALTGCWIQDAEERAECDRALAIVCACAAVDCESPSAPPIVDTLRRCDADEIIRDRGYHLSACIQESPRYCDVLSGLVTESPALCDVDCTSSCDQEEACHDAQYRSCDLSSAGAP